MRNSKHNVFKAKYATVETAATMDIVEKLGRAHLSDHQQQQQQLTLRIAIVSSAVVGCAGILA